MGWGDTTNRSEVFALPAFKRLGQKELRGQYTAQAQKSDESCKTRPFPGLCNRLAQKHKVAIYNHSIFQVKVINYLHHMNMYTQYTYFYSYYITVPVMHLKHQYTVGPTK